MAYPIRLFSGSSGVNFLRTHRISRLHASAGGGWPGAQPQPWPNGFDAAQGPRPGGAGGWGGPTDTAFGGAGSGSWQQGPGLGWGGPPLANGQGQPLEPPRRRYPYRPPKSIMYTKLQKQAQKDGGVTITRDDVMAILWETSPDDIDCMWLAEDLIRGGNLPAVFAVLLYMDRVKVYGRPEFYGKLMQTMATMDAPRDAMVAMGYAIRAEVGVDDLSYNRVIGKFGTTGRWQDAIKILLLAREHDAKIAAEVYGIVIEEADKARQPSLVIEIYKEMRRQGQQGDVKTFATVLRCYDQLIGWKETLEVFGDIRQPVTIHYNLIIGTLARAAQADPAMQLFLEMRPARVMPDAMTYNLLMQAYAGQGDWRAAENLFRELINSELIPTADSYSALIQSYAMEGQWHRAVTQFDAMVQARIPPSVATYEGLLKCLANGQQLEAVLLVYEDVLATGLLPTVAIYEEVFMALWHLGRHQEAKEVYDRMLSEGIKPDAHLSAFFSPDPSGGMQGSGSWLETDQLPGDAEAPVSAQIVADKPDEPLHEDVFVDFYAEAEKAERLRNAKDDVEDASFDSDEI